MNEKHPKIEGILDLTFNIYTYSFTLEKREIVLLDEEN